MQAHYTFTRPTVEALIQHRHLPSFFPFWLIETPLTVIAVAFFFCGTGQR